MAAVAPSETGASVGSGTASAGTTSTRPVARPTFGGSSWRDQLNDAPVRKPAPAKPSSLATQDEEDFPSVAPGLVQQRRNVLNVRPTVTTAPRPEPMTSAWGSRPSLAHQANTSSGAEQHEEALYGRDAATTVRPAGVRPQKSASKQPQRFAPSRAPIHGGGFPQWTEVRFRPSDDAAVEVPEDKLTREPQYLQELIREGGEVVNGMVEQYQEDKVDPSATQLKIAELQDWDEDRLILGSKLISEGKSLKKAAREVGVLTGALQDYYEHHYEQSSDEDDY